MERNMKASHPPLQHTCSEAQLIGFLAGIVIKRPYPHPSGSLPGALFI